MRIIWANWRLVLRGRGSILLVLLVPLWVLLFRPAGLWSLLVLYPVILNPFSGAQTDNAKKAFTFGLPGYRDMMRRMILTDAVLGGLLFSVFGVLWFDERIWPMVALYVFAGFVVGFAFSILMATLSLIPSVLVPALHLLVSIPFWIVLLFVLGVVAAEPWLIWPVAVLLCGAVSVLVWHRLCDGRDVTQAHRRILHLPHKRRAQVGEGRLSSLRIDAFFLDRMASSRPFSPGRCVWGDLYGEFGPFLGYWRWLIVLLFFCALVLGYVDRLIVVLVFIGMVPIAINLTAPSRFVMLLPEGRTERFYSAVARALAAALWVLACALALVGLSWPLAMLIPDISLGIITLHYGPIDTTCLWLACLLVPWFEATRLLERDVPLAAYLPTILAVGSLILAIAILNDDLCSHSRAFARILFATNLVGGWAYLLLVLDYIFSRSDLASARPLKGGRP